MFRVILESPILIVSHFVSQILEILARAKTGLYELLFRSGPYELLCEEDISLDWVNSEKVWILIDKILEPLFDRCDKVKLGEQNLHNLKIIAVAVRCSSMSPRCLPPLPLYNTVTWQVHI